MAKTARSDEFKRLTTERGFRDGYAGVPRRRPRHRPAAYDDGYREGEKQWRQDEALSLQKWREDHA